MAKDFLKLAALYHQAMNDQDWPAIEKMFIEDAEYHSPAMGSMGGLYGRSVIMTAMKAYYAEFSDQIAHDDSVELTGDNVVRSHWRLIATAKSSGRVVKRQGTETIRFNPKGLITMVEVRDVVPTAD